MILIDLPSLQSIKLGATVFYGVWNDDSCSLTMRSTMKQFEINECRSPKSNIHYFWRK